MRPFTLTLLLCSAISLTACEKPHREKPPAPLETIGKIEVWDSSISDIISVEAPIEVLASGFIWSEGPTWDAKRQQLYFSDVPRNKAYAWSKAKGLTTFLDPSGIPNEKTEGFREPGSNGLLIMPDGDLLIANHGKRAIERLNINSGNREIVVDDYDGLPLNSPNDITRAKDGTLFFTDPPYGLEDLDASPLKKLAFNGVYQLSPDGKLSVIDTSQTFPNGIALSPDETYLYVAISDPKTPKIIRYTKNADQEFDNGELWFDALPYKDKGLLGLPDGMAVSNSGHVFATGPGGVFILSPKGKALGQIRTGRASANCTFGDDGKTLYITAGNTLVRVRVLQGIDQ